MAERHLITSEYPPQPGGVSDYTRMIAEGLAAAGDEVHVWCPKEQGEGGRGKWAEVGGHTSEVVGHALEDGRQKAQGSLMVHRELGRFTRSDLRFVDRQLDQFKAPRRLLVQWVPHGYGYRAMNLHFCLWLWRRARGGDAVELMVHEPFLSFREGSWKQTGVAIVHRLMTMILLRAASRVWMTIPAWEAFWRPYALGRPLKFNWLPAASNISVIEDPDGVRAIRARYTGSAAMLVGHFGTYDRNITELLLKSVPALMQNGQPQGMLLIGRGSEAMRDELIHNHPALADRVHASGTLAAAELSLHVSACDLMLQPYIDGVSSRRTSTMVALAHGVPVVTTRGKLTESLWSESDAVSLAPVTDLSALVNQAQLLLRDEDERRRMGTDARALYQNRFDVAHAVAALRGTVSERLV